ATHSLGGGHIAPPLVAKGGNLFMPIARSRVVVLAGVLCVGAIASGGIALSACGNAKLSLGTNNDPGCTLPGPGTSGSGPAMPPAYDGLVRVANLVPTSDLADVCIRASGSTSWGLPILF